MLPRLVRSETLLAGDIGGTKTVLALIAGGDVRRPTCLQTTASADITEFAQLVETFLADSPPDVRPAAASFAVAGPVLGESARLTNLPWSIEAPVLRDRCRLQRVDLINDVQALAWAIPSLRTDDVKALWPTTDPTTGTVAVLALGTGLGQACLATVRGGRAALPSEAGHADFAPQDALQERLLHALRKEFDHVSVENVCSGIALPHLYRFLRNAAGPAGERTPTAGASATTPEIVAAARHGTSSVAVAAVELLADILAAECGNAALRWLSVGGVYIGGGLALHILPFLDARRFRDRFVAKGRFSSLLERIPVYAVLSPEAILWGAALFGLTEGDAQPG